RLAGDAARGLREADLDHLPRIVPLVHGVGGVESLVTLQAHERAAEPGRERLRHLGLAHARLALEEQRPLELQGQEDRSREPALGDVVLAREQRRRGVDARGMWGGVAQAAPTARAAITEMSCARYSGEPCRSRLSPFASTFAPFAASGVKLFASAASTVEARNTDDAAPV